MNAALQLRFFRPIGRVLSRALYSDASSPSPKISGAFNRRQDAFMPTTPYNISSPSSYKVSPEGALPGEETPSADGTENNKKFSPSFLQPEIIHPPKWMTSFYTGKPEFYECVAFLADTYRILCTEYAFPPIDELEMKAWADKQLVLKGKPSSKKKDIEYERGIDAFWKHQTEMSHALGFPLNPQEYYEIIARLYAIKGLLKHMDIDIEKSQNNDVSESSHAYLREFLRGLTKDASDAQSKRLAASGSKGGDGILERLLDENAALNVDLRLGQVVPRKNGTNKAIAMGFRKTSVAHVWLIPNDHCKNSSEIEHTRDHGQVYLLMKQELNSIDSRDDLIFREDYAPIQDSFTHWKDLLQIYQPFHVTDTYGQYDVFCRAISGGHSGTLSFYLLRLFPIEIISFLGQAQAIKLGISRALAALRPDLAMKLDLAGLLTRDTRRRERKKPGRKRARKGFTWKRR